MTASIKKKSKDSKVLQVIENTKARNDAPRKRGRPKGSTKQPIPLKKALKSSELQSSIREKEASENKAVFLNKRGRKPKNIPPDAMTIRVVLEKEDLAFLQRQAEATGTARHILVAKYVTEARYRIEKQGGKSDFEAFINWALKSKDRAPGCEQICLAAEKFFHVQVKKQQRLDQALADHSTH